MSLKPLMLAISWSLLYFVIAKSQDTTQQQDDTIQWSSENKLKWEDFKGEPVADNPSDAFTTTDISAIEWKCDRENRFIFTGAQARFNKDKSWVKDDKKSDELLKHEQGHFEITEIYARKLREALRKIECDKKSKEQIQKEVDDAADKIDKEWDKEAEKYDEETDHGKDKKKQEKWDEKINKELEKMKNQ